MSVYGVVCITLLVVQGIFAVGFAACFSRDWLKGMKVFAIGSYVMSVAVFLSWLALVAHLAA